MKKKRKSLLPAYILFIVSISLLLYPAAGELYNYFHQSKAVEEYSETVKAYNNGDIQKMIAEAKRYNDLLFRAYSGYEIAEDSLPDYNSILNITEDGMMGYIVIPKINCRLAIRHGTSDAVLQNNAGHFETSSFPVGGENTHAVITGHRGLPSARLFTDLDVLGPGDEFMIDMLGEILTYRIDQIKEVLPHETDDLRIAEGKDYITLVTCTPYGVNSHRLLIRGERIETTEETMKAMEETASVSRAGYERIILAASAAFLAIILFVLLVGKKKRRRC